MKHDITTLNHVGLLVSDLDVAVTRYEQLGFLFTPLSSKIAFRPGADLEEAGAGKRDAIFQENFLEIAGVTDREIWGKLIGTQRGSFNIDEALRRYEGLHVLYFGTNNIEAVHERLQKQGLPISGIGHLQRNVDTPDGERILHAKMLHTPQISIAQHESPELLFQPRHQQHRNKATALTECIVCTDDPTERIALYERYTEHPGSQKGHFQILDLGNARVIVVAPEFLDEIIPGGVSYTPPFFAGFTVATTDLDAVRAVLAENTIPFHEHHGRLVVRPEDACGSAVLFEQEGTTRH